MWAYFLPTISDCRLVVLAHLSGAVRTPGQAEPRTHVAVVAAPDGGLPVVAYPVVCVLARVRAAAKCRWAACRWVVVEGIL